MTTETKATEGATENMLSDATIREKIASAKNQTEIRRIIADHIKSIFPSTPRGQATNWFRDAWNTFIGEASPSEDENMLSAFKNWLTPERMQQHSWHEGKPIAESYFKALARKFLKRSYVLKNEEENKQKKEEPISK